MKWVKPSGLEIEANDNPETNAYLESLGYKRKTVKKKAVKKAAKKK